MTFNFDTYSANVQYTPKTILDTDLASFGILSLQLPSIAFKHDKNLLQNADSATDADYAVQLFYIYDTINKGTAGWAALVGFTWELDKTNNTGKNMHFGIYEFAKPDSATSPNKVSNIKIYKCAYGNTLQANYSAKDKVESTDYTRTGISILDIDDNGSITLGNTVLGYESTTSGSTTNSTFYLPPKSFFLEGKHVDVTIPYVTGTLEVTPVIPVTPTTPSGIIYAKPKQ